MLNSSQTCAVAETWHFWGKHPVGQKYYLSPLQRLKVFQSTNHFKYRPVFYAQVNKASGIQDRISESETQLVSDGNENVNLTLSQCHLHTESTGHCLIIQSFSKCIVMERNVEPRRSSFCCFSDCWYSLTWDVHSWRDCVNTRDGH